MLARLGPPDELVLPTLEKYRRRGAHHDCLPFGSGNIEAFGCFTRGPITRQSPR